MNLPSSRRETRAALKAMGVYGQVKTLLARRSPDDPLPDKGAPRTARTRAIKRVSGGRTR